MSAWKVTGSQNLTIKLCVLQNEQTIDIINPATRGLTVSEVVQTQVYETTRGNTTEGHIGWRVLGALKRRERGVR
jgi:hypothetical protein